MKTHLIFFSFSFALIFLSSLFSLASRLFLFFSLLYHSTKKKQMAQMELCSQTICALFIRTSEETIHPSCHFFFSPLLFFLLLLRRLPLFMIVFAFFHRSRQTFFILLNPAVAPFFFFFLRLSSFY